MTFARPIEARLRGTRRAQVVGELLGNSAHFPIANLFYEAIREGADMLRTADAYTLLGACLVQARYLGGRQYDGRPQPLAGNLVGPAIYTLVEGVLEGPAFFTAPQHIAYWCFALAIGLLQHAQLKLSRGAPEVAFSLAEGLVRAGILLAVYWMLEVAANPADARVSTFLTDSSHVFIVLALCALGLLVGLLQWHARRGLRLLRDTAADLHKFSEWAWGREVLERAIADGDRLALRRETRSVLFVDIRGFTAWSERNSPETVVEMLNHYYAALESALRDLRPVKSKYTADEAMVVFSGARAALDAAAAMRCAASGVLAEHGLAAGIGVHTGPTVEGLLGSPDVKLYDVIGDTVNVAKRLCDQAAGGEVLASIECVSAAGLDAQARARRALSVKGKSAPLDVCVL